MTALIAIAMMAGLAMRLVCGRSMRDLERVRLRGEALLLVLLVAQLALPTLKLSGGIAQVAFWTWAATYPALVGICLVNRRIPGMVMLGVGLVLNGVVVILNGGMPVSQLALDAIRPGRVLSIPATDFVHVVLRPSTLVPWLGDALPIQGPSWLAAIASPGDCLLLVGIFDFLGRMELGSQVVHSE